MANRDPEYAVCPYCRHRHGDCPDWLASETPKDVECDECGKTFVAWAEYDVSYCTQPKVAKP